jgi:hypothetical protein
MAGLAKLKADKKNEFVGFGNGGSRKLGERDDLDELAIIALESGNKSLIDLFEPLPPLAELKKAQTDSKLKAVPGAGNQAGADQESKNPEVAEKGPVTSEILPQPEARSSNQQTSQGTKG